MESFDYGKALADAGRLEEAMREEKERYGGFYSEFWVALARKPL